MRWSHNASQRAELVPPLFDMGDKLKSPRELRLAGLQKLQVEVVPRFQLAVQVVAHCLRISSSRSAKVTGRPGRTCCET